MGRLLHDETDAYPQPTSATVMPASSCAVSPGSVSRRLTRKWRTHTPSDLRSVQSVSSLASVPLEFYVSYLAPARHCASFDC